MKPPNLNERTLDLVIAWGIEHFPERERWVDVSEPGELDDRYVVIGNAAGWDDAGERLMMGGCWQTLADAIESYDYNAGPPAYVVDLFAEPDKALFPVKLSWGLPTGRGADLSAHTLNRKAP